MTSAVWIVGHAPDPVDMERYWIWYCTCGDGSDREFASREDAEDAAELHHCEWEDPGDG